MLKGISFAFRYTLGVVRHHTIRFLRRTLSFLALLWALAFLFGKTSETLQVVVQPLCFISGISHSSLCISHPPPTRVPKYADFPALVEIQSATFEQLLDDFVHVSVLSLNVQKAEMGTSELNEMIRRVEYQNDEHFTASLSDYIGTVKETVLEMQIFGLYVQDTVDRIVATSNLSLSTLEGAHTKAVQYSFHSLILWSSPFPDKTILKIFSEFMDMLSQITEILILKTQLQLKNLEDTERNRIVVHDFIVQAKSGRHGRDTLIWGYLHACGLEILKFVGEYLQPATQYVSSALNTLHEMSGNITALRERVAKSAPYGAYIPPEVHMNSIKKGLEVLEASIRKASERKRDSRRPFV
ncbi:hypothetical protein ARMGADRAFT_937842 [Armillaria gallica]|uniref:Uncharacterized protein n=1 Tax=Armillaria gallica TaxID=47427 RepID=A0A2H3D9I2_ARMGA|nr:hypothetical protein ARMGADRAFT_937842 [Armillaria gallica]